MVDVVSQGVSASCELCVAPVLPNSLQADLVSEFFTQIILKFKYKFEHMPRYSIFALLNG